MDTVIHSVQELEQFCDRFEVRGFGGTDFRPAFGYVDGLIQKGELTDLKGLLYFTDGFGTYPQCKPDYDVAFVFFQEDYAAPQTPPWAIRVVLGPEELAVSDEGNQGNPHTQEQTI